MVGILRLQGYTNILAGITLPNPGSVAFHENFGFKKIGEYHRVGYKFGKWRDTGWWEMALKEPGYVPGEILSLQEVMNSPEGKLVITLPELK
jgi:phosphinothricin acetyltransferase